MFDIFMRTSLTATLVVVGISIVLTCYPRGEAGMKHWTWVWADRLSSWALMAVIWNIILCIIYLIWRMP